MREGQGTRIDFAVHAAIAVDTCWRCWFYIAIPFARLCQIVAWFLVRFQNLDEGGFNFQMVKPLAALYMHAF